MNALCDDCMDEVESLGYAPAPDLKSLGWSERTCDLSDKDTSPTLAARIAVVEM